MCRDGGLCFGRLCCLEEDGIQLRYLSCFNLPYERLNSYCVRGTWKATTETVMRRRGMIRYGLCADNYTSRRSLGYPAYAGAWQATVLICLGMPLYTIKGLVLTTDIMDLVSSLCLVSCSMILLPSHDDDSGYIDVRASKPSCNPDSGRVDIQRYLSLASAERFVCPTSACSGVPCAARKMSSSLGIRLQPTNGES